MAGLDTGAAGDHDRGVGTALAEFELTDAERAVPGLELDHSELRVRQTRRSLVSVGMATAMFIGFGVWMVADPNRAHLGRTAVRNPEANVTLGVVLIVLVVIVAYGHLRPVARADSQGVEVRSLLRSRRYAWTEVADVRIDVPEVGRANVTLGGDSTWLPLRRRPFEARAVLQLTTGELVVLGGLVATVSSATLLADHPTALKVAALARWREAHAGPPVPVAVMERRERIWPLLLSVAGYTAVLSWAAGRFAVDPFMMVVTVVFVGRRFWPSTD